MRRGLPLLLAVGGLAYAFRRQIGRLLTRLTGTWIGSPDDRR